MQSRTLHNFNKYFGSTRGTYLNFFIFQRTLPKLFQWSGKHTLFKLRRQLLVINTQTGSGQNAICEDPGHWKRTNITSTRSRLQGKTQILKLRKKIDLLFLQNLPYLQHIVLAGNRLSILEEKSLPVITKQLHVGRNQLTSLNGTLREMSELEWLFINSNRLTSIDGQLPQNGKLVLIHATNNLLEKLPQDLKNLQKIETLFFQHNLITSLDGAVSKSKKLKRLQLSNNKIKMVSKIFLLELE